VSKSPTSKCVLDRLKYNAEQVKFQTDLFKTEVNELKIIM
jgi:hypothetical protein